MRKGNAWMAAALKPHARCLWSAGIILLLACSGTSGEPPRLMSVSIAPRDVVIASSIDLQFSAAFNYDRGSSGRATGVVWNSSSPAVASIDANGKATGLAKGTTVIRAEAGGLRDSTTLTVTAASASGPLRVSTTNPRYFADPSGRPVYLTGSEYWKTIQDNGRSNPPPQFDYSAFLDFLQSHNHNFTRLYMWEQARWSSEETSSSWFSPTLYERPGPAIGRDGGPKFDLTRINAAYLSRVRQRAVDAGKRGIYVSVMLFDGWSVQHKGSSTGSNPWDGHPFNAANNINGINGDPNGDGSGSETQTLAIPAVTALQEAYVRAVVDAVNDLDNVIYEICNECDQAGDAWQYHMIGLIRTYERGKPKQHPIGMTVPYPTVPRGSNSDVLNSDADWVSMNGDINAPAVADGSKVSLSDTDHICGICGDPGWPWKSFTRGHNALLMDGYDGSAGVGDPKYDPNDPVWEAIRTSMGYARSFALKMDLARALPRGDLASTGYCLADAGREYLVFLPSGGSVSVNLSGVSGSPTVEWFNPANGQAIAAGSVAGGGTVTLTAPFAGMAVVYIRQ
jgi:hypothetical protein